MIMNMHNHHEHDRDNNSESFSSSSTSLPRDITSLSAFFPLIDPPSISVLQLSRIRRFAEPGGVVVSAGSHGLTFAPNADPLDRTAPVLEPRTPPSVVSLEPVRLAFPSLPPFGHRSVPGLGR